MQHSTTVSTSESGGRTLDASLTATKRVTDRVV
jgi:hypothetical protein